MCGICGIFRPEGTTPCDLHTVSAMVTCLRHRGPDNRETLQDGRVVLGHDRLSILDLSAAAHQPMRSADGRFLLVYNGEIYNHALLRAQLEHHGRVFRTNSDTEVLLELFSALGTACLPLLNGMFAFAVWDRRDQRLTLAGTASAKSLCFMPKRRKRSSSHPRSWPCSDIRPWSAALISTRFFTTCRCSPFPRPGARSKACANAARALPEHRSGRRASALALLDA